MIESKKEMKQWIELERKVWIKRNYPSGVKKKVFRKELLFQSVLRHAEYYSNVKGASKIIGIYWKILFKIMSSRHNVMIPLNVFGKGLLIAHLQNIVVSSNSTVGRNCCLFHGTTIGISLGKDDNGKCPVIGDGVTICAGAGVFGDIQIADDVMIASNAVVVKNIETCGAVVSGVPAKIIGMNSGWNMNQFVKGIEEE